MGSFTACYSQAACIKGAVCSKTQRQFDHSAAFIPFPSLTGVFLLGGLGVMLLDHLLSYTVEFNGASNIWPTVLEQRRNEDRPTKPSPADTYL